MRTLELTLRGCAPLFGASLALLLAGCPSRDWTPEALRAPLTSDGPPLRMGGPALSRPNDLRPSTAADFARQVTVILEGAAPGPRTGAVTFALPLIRGAVKNVDDLRVSALGKRIDVLARPLLADYAPDGSSRGLRSVFIEIPAGALPSLPASVTVAFGAPSAAAGGARTAFGPARPSKLTFANTSRPVEVKVSTATYGVESRGSSFAAVPRSSSEKTVFASVEPKVMANLPPGYLAATGILGEVMTKAELATRPDLAGMVFLSDAFVRFADGAMGAAGYPLQPASVGLETEAWLYDRCATYLLAYAHGGDANHLRYGLRTCARYARDIDLEGERRGIYRGKKDRDLKYSHVRGIYAYYALTGDEAALDAGRAMADMWNDDPLFVQTYRAGTMRGPDKLWTERLLAASIEGGVYGFAMTGEARHLASARALVKVAVRHVTTVDRAELRTITKTSFPPQSCFVHNALQQAEGNENQPWCSSWMSELVIDPLLRFVEITGERDAEEILLRLARSMRDAGTTYFQKNPLDDSFLAPTRPFTATGEDPRILVPLYGYGIDEKGTRRSEGEWSDFEHCPDATAITAAAMMVLRRRGGWDAPPVPASAELRVDLSRFKSEGASLLALHHELAFCAAQTLKNATREHRDPSRASADLLASAARLDGTAQEKALVEAKIGWPVYEVSPARKLSWWFNTSIGQLSWLASARVPIGDLKPGAISPP